MYSQLNCYTLACMHSRVNCYTPACVNSRGNSFISTCMHSRANRYTPASLYVFSIELLYSNLYGFSKRLYSCNPAVGSCMRTQKLKSHLVRTQSLNVLTFKPGVGQYIAIHATLTARDFFFVYFYTSGPFTCIFSKASPDLSLCWLWLTHGSCVGPQNKIGHPAGCRFPC